MPSNKCQIARLFSKHASSSFPYSKRYKILAADWTRRVVILKRIIQQFPNLALFSQHWDDRVPDRVSGSNDPSHLYRLHD
jgi:hypothetical protein